MNYPFGIDRYIWFLAARIRPSRFPILFWLHIVTGVILGCIGATFSPQDAGFSWLLLGTCMSISLSCLVLVWDSYIGLGALLVGGLIFVNLSTEGLVNFETAALVTSGSVLVTLGAVCLDYSFSQIKR